MTLATPGLSQTISKGRHARLVRLADASPDYIWVLSLDGAITCMNGAAQRLCDGAPEPARWSRAWSEESRSSAERAVSAARAGRAWKFRSRRTAANGTPLYLDTTVSPVRDGSGKVSQLLAVGIDVTAQIESQAFLATVIDALPQALTVRDLRSGRLVLANRAAEERTSTPSPNGDEAVAALSVDDAAAIAGAQRVHRIDTVETPAGVRRFETLKIATYDDSGPRHLINLSSDVTDEHADRETLRRALEAAQAADLAKSAFLANMSHEIRTPLNGVVAGLDALERRRSSDSDRELIEMIRASAAALTARIDELFAARDDADSTLRQEPFDLEPLLRRIIDTVAALAAPKGLQLRLEIAPDVPPTLLGDPTCVRAALTPLMDNAVKFTDAGRVTVRVERLADSRLRFAFIDTGVGFDATAKASLFDRFGRQDQSLTRRFGGLGLGLDSARCLAQRMGGTIDARARPRGGSIFWIDLPLPAADVGHTMPTSPPPRRLRVLAADDHPTNRRVLELILGDLADVVAVEDGLRAVEAARDSPFDVILMDIQMPVMDGIAAVAAIREEERARGAAATPVIMLTANTEKEHVRAGRQAGADRHIGKPFTAPVLLEAIDGVLAGVTDPGGEEETHAA